MSHIRKTFLIALCLLCCALLTGCYSDKDPFPSSDQLNGNGAAVTLAPATAVPTSEPYATPDAAAPVLNAAPPTDASVPQPPVTPEPLPEDAVDVSPNFNG